MSHGRSRADWSARNWEIENLSMSGTAKEPFTQRIPLAGF